MATTHNAHSDLIHLFIDGEATETERNILFGALKDSPELQEEFSSAMQLKQAFATDISKLQPPSYLQSQITERAGLIVAASSSIATAPIVMNSVSTAISNIAPIAATGISKGLMTLLIGTTVGVLSTIGIIEYTKGPSAVADRPSTVAETRHSVAQNAQAQTLSAQPEITPQASNADAATHASNSANVSHASAAMIPALPQLRVAANVPDLHFSKATLNQQHNTVKARQDAVNTIDVAQNNIPVTPAANNDVNINERNVPAAPEMIAETPAMGLISLADPIVPVTKNVGYNPPGHNLFSNGSEGYFNEPDWMARLSVNLRYTGMMTQFMQAHDDFAAAPSWNEMGLAVKYELSPFSAIGIEGGQETFPVYLIRNGAITDHHSILWMGASWTQSFPLFQLLGIHPEVRGVLGASDAGPIGKISAGLAWRANDYFGFSIAPEATALFIKENGAITAGGKLGLSASIMLHF